MTTPEANPVILNAAGVKNVYAYGNYKFAIYDANDVLIRTLDNQYYMVPSTTAEVVNSIAFADSPYSATAANQLRKVNTTDGAVTIYPPTAVGNEGIEIIVIKTSSDANAVTLDSDTLFTQDINVASTAVLGTDQYSFLGVTSDNANWFISQNVNTATVTASSTTTMTNKTLTAPVLGGTVTGTYTLGGTPTITVQSWQDVDGGGGRPSIGAGWTIDKTVSYMKDPMGFVHLRGYAYVTGGSTAVFTLLAGYRPAQDSYFVANYDLSENNFEMVTIPTTGVIVASKTGAGDGVFLDGIIFKAA
jgi:hypothetical protein